MKRPPLPLLAGLFLLSMAALMLEVLESRVFAFVLWHHLGFMIISMAMLGLAAAGSFITVRAERITGRWRSALGWSALGFGAAVIISHAIMARLPLALNWRIIGWMALLYPLAFAPFFFAGIGLALPFRLWPEHSGRLYTWSMIGSGAGTLVVMALLTRLGAPRLLTAIAVIAAVAGALFTMERPLGWKAAAKWAAVLAVLAVAFWGAPRLMDFRPFGGKLMSQRLALNPSAKVEATGWTPYCRIDVVDLGNEAAAPYQTRIVYQDGDEPTSILHVDQSTDLSVLAALSPYNTAYLVKPDPKKMLIIGSGGGLEVHLARFHRVPDVTAVEINPFTISLAEGRWAQWTDHIYTQPGVHLVNAEGRSYLRRSGKKYDLITLNAVDTYTSLASGAYVLSESYLYTVEAMTEYLGHLAPGGCVSFYRIEQQPPRETMRLVALAVEAMDRMGVPRPEQRIVIINQGPGFTMIVSKNPFTGEDVKRIKARVAAYGRGANAGGALSAYMVEKFPRRLTYAPGEPCSGPYCDFLDAVREGRGREAINDSPLGLSSITDDSPYFFKYSLAEFVLAKPGVKLGPALILIQILQTGLLAVLLIIWPLRRLPGSGTGGAGLVRPLVYFTGLGLGYLFIEVAAMQKLVLFLGNPTYSLSVTLSALLISSGLGAMWVERRPEKHPGRTAALVIAGATVAWMIAAPHIAHAFLGDSLAWRIVLACLMILPLGFIMGMPFPAGLRQISENNTDIVPWAWAVNSAASVMAAILCVPLAMNSSFTTVMLIAAGLYALAAWSGPGGVKVST